MSSVNPSGEMPFLEHVRELRQRLMVSVSALALAAVGAYLVYNQIVLFLIEPFGEDLSLQVLGVTDAFFIKIKLSLFCGLLFSLPVHAYGAVRFIFPGLLPKEKRFVGFSLMGSIVLSVVGVLFGYELLLPIALDFLRSTALLPVDEIQANFEFGKAMFFIFQTIFGVIIVFQVPLVVLFLIVFNVVSTKTLLKSSRYIIVGIFIVSAILTPPDPTTQMLISLPLIVLFYSAILIAKIFNLGKKT